MNELLGWYGYDKVELRDSDSLEIGETPQHISVLKGMKSTTQCNTVKCFVYTGKYMQFFTFSTMFSFAALKKF